MPERAHLAITFPRVEGYTQAIRNRVSLDWSRVPSLVLEPGRIPPEVEVKGLHATATGRPSLSGPGKIDAVGLERFRNTRRVQELAFDVASALTRQFREQRGCEVPAHALFPQLASIVRRYVDEKVTVQKPADLRDLFLAPYYGWLIEILLENLSGDVGEGESPELPLLEATRGPGSTADVDFWTRKDVRAVLKSQVNFVVADTKRWEQSAAFFLDTHKKVETFAKNAGLGFGIPYFYNGETHEYVPDFIVRLKQRSGTAAEGTGQRHLVLETKGFDPLKQIKSAAAERWCAAVNAHGEFGSWTYRVVDKPEGISEALDSVFS